LWFFVCDCCKKFVLAMTTEQLRSLHQAKPFRPFTIHMADGTSVAVNHPELLLHTQGGRTAFVNTEGENVTIVDRLLVTKLTYQTENGSRRRRRS
jgi:hypothetical protein